MENYRLVAFVTIGTAKTQRFASQSETSWPSYHLKLCKVAGHPVIHEVQPVSPVHRTKKDAEQYLKNLEAAIKQPIVHKGSLIQG